MAIFAATLRRQHWTRGVATPVHARFFFPLRGRFGCWREENLEKYREIKRNGRLASRSPHLPSPGRGEDRDGTWGIERGPEAAEDRYEMEKERIRGRGGRAFSIYINMNRTAPSISAAFCSLFLSRIGCLFSATCGDFRPRVSTDAISSFRDRSIHRLCYRASKRAIL